LSDDDLYVYPGTKVLQNKFGITDGSALAEVEREFFLERLQQGTPGGNFDLPHLCAIHRHLFRDVYAWAGELRTVEIAKGGNTFQLFKFIETGMADIHTRLAKRKYLADLSAASFADEAAKIIGDLNYVHPFREGNGRTQLEYLRQLAERAGYPIDPSHLQPKRWLAASIAAHNADYKPMADEIGNVINLDRGR
jgi:cell filamentation protein